MHPNPSLPPLRIILAGPRGFCAGVDRAVVAVERALEIHGAPVYVRKQIVHNKHVVATLERRGAIDPETVLASPVWRALRRARGKAPRPGRRALRNALRRERLRRALARGG